ncbi:MAG: acetate--CoA ligase family protein [Candidatus Altiarchaeota archaeon]|nr:acetate--CoA ligase family protein [Candidatus Altiarchaeota archaeon]
MKKKPEIKKLFSPCAVAVIGASHSPGKIGYKIVENILSGGYGGEVYPVNPEGGEILGLAAYKNVRDAPGPVDVAVIAIPSKLVYEAVKDCAEKKVKYALIISSGFSESGNADEEKKIAAYAKKHGMRIIGPNIFGMYSAESALNATFGTRDVRSGNIAIITQSGALGISLMGRTALEKIGLSAMFSLGNKSDMDESDLLEYLIKDPGTKIIMMYMEGIKNGERLVRILKGASSKKPVIVIKAGRSGRGAMAAASHTGSLAGSEAVFSDVMKQCGVIRAENIKEALDWSKYLADAPEPKGENTVIITNGGGMGVLAADACEKHSVSLYDDASALRKTFSGVVPTFGSIKNPVDLTGQAKIEDYKSAIESALKNRDTHSVICLGCETAFFDPAKTEAMIKELHKENKPKKPVVYSFFGGAGMEKCIKELSESRIPAYSDVYEAVSCMGALYADYRNKKYLVAKKAPESGIRIDNKAIAAILKKAAAENRDFLLSYEAEEVMKAAGIKTPKSFIAKNLYEAVKHARKTGYPAALKIVSRDIIHKSDAGGVALDLENRREVIDAYQAVMHNCRRYKPGARIEGVQVSRMIPKDVEVITGALRDPSFGPVVMYGLGGIYVEILGDVSFRSFPLGRKEVEKMIHETRSSRILLGARGEGKKDINSVVDVILRLGTILKKHPDISEIEINPLMVHADQKGVMAPDTRILLSKIRGR